MKYIVEAWMQLPIVICFIIFVSVFVILSFVAALFMPLV